jgi:predicted HicB family RNase H-like nuclease
MPESVVHFQIRMPPVLHERLASLALERKESLNAMVVEALRAAVEAKAGRKPAGRDGHPPRR